MWQNEKVRFCLLEENQDEEETGWFNIFSLHQNRDLGRGSKNCVHESMIPDWMDLVIWGHEHECLIDPMESLVGTFRISQPGSTVATSLTDGESARKHVGILDIRGNQFRLQSLPLLQIRSFSMGEIVLQNEQLDVDDPKVDEKLFDLLEKHVTELTMDAREKTKKLQAELKDARKLQLEQMFQSNNPKLKYEIQKPDQVLVRLRVDHSGFSTLNNQRFGSRFVGEIANPSDILLFHRRRQINSAKVNNTDSKKKNTKTWENPIDPGELEKINIEDLISDNLNLGDKNLGILDEKKLSNALEEFVDKAQLQSFTESCGQTIMKQQNKLIKRGFSNNRDLSEEGKVTTKASIREICKAEAIARAEVILNKKKEQEHEQDSDEQIVQNNTNHSTTYSGSEDENNGTICNSIQKKDAVNNKRKKVTNSTKSRMTSSTKRPRRTNTANKNYSFDSDDSKQKSDDEFTPANTHDSDDSISTKTSHWTDTKTPRNKPVSSRSNTINRSMIRKTTNTTRNNRTTLRSTIKKKSLYDSDSDDDNDDVVFLGSSSNKESGWGIASTYKNKRSKQR